MTKVRIETSVLNPSPKLLEELGLSRSRRRCGVHEQITHKMVAKAGKGRRLSRGVQVKILNAVNAASKQRSRALRAVSITWGGFECGCSLPLSPSAERFLRSWIGGWPLHHARSSPNCPSPIHHSMKALRAGGGAAASSRTGPLRSRRPGTRRDGVRSFGDATWSWRPGH